MPLRHGLSRVSAFASIALRQPPAAALPIPRMLRPGKSIHGFSGDCRSASHFCMLQSRHPWIFRGLQNCYAILHALSRPPCLVIDWQVRAKKSIHGFFRVWGCPINSLHSVIPNSFRNLYAICNVDAEIGCKQPCSA